MKRLTTPKPARRARRMARRPSTAVYPVSDCAARERARHLINCTAADGDRRFENWAYPNS